MNGESFSGKELKMQRCRVCRSFKLKRVFTLGKQPLANNFLKYKDQKEKTYPLELYECQHCKLLQLGYVVDKKKMYDEYTYIPSVSKVYLDHFKSLAKKLIDNIPLQRNSLVVDIGGSDGSFLECFKNKGMEILNVEPAKNIEVNEGISVITDYFTPKVALDIVDNYGKARLVTATNSFAHIDNLQEYIEALDILLHKDGVFFAQFPDVRNLLKENQFDTIYHEHLSYFTYEPLHHLFANTPFELFNITSDNIHGGSMQIWVRRRPKLLENFQVNVESIRTELNLKINSYQTIGKKIVGFGAAAKGTVLLNYCNIKLDYIVDGTPYKQGKFVPGVKTPIYPEEHLLEDSPDIVLILAWNFKDEIMDKLKGRGYTFIVPIPTVQIYEDSNS